MPQGDIKVTEKQFSNMKTGMRYVTNVAQAKGYLSCEF
jgi:hypothetical protein